ncbi:hypothetical protein [Flavobacterium chungangensis]|uniref:Uncharacterized protein n=1 Tax=Flavobacterium chungangensis TaxID=2708132 RepID=A0ABV8ZBE7_9FLAO
MNTYIIILGEITNKIGDEKFANFVDTNNFEFWRHTPLNWILLTPKNVKLDTINRELKKAYGQVFICVLKVAIEGFAGHYLAKRREDNPFNWFKDIYIKEGFVPKWENVQENEIDLDDDGQIGLTLE